VGTDLLQTQKYADDMMNVYVGGTGSHKVSGNYSPGFLPQRVAIKQGYDQILWLLKNENGSYQVTEAGIMNIFVVVSREDGGRPIMHSRPSWLIKVKLL
jgi:branched-chain amino acid aminotransferase